MLEDARIKYLSPNPEVRHEALQELWDAWERLKTVEPAQDKRESITSLLDKAADEPKFREMLEVEARELTRIGNTFLIRHSETTQIAIQRDAQIDYVFHRLFALIQILLRSRQGSQSGSPRSRRDVLSVLFTDHFCRRYQGHPAAPENVEAVRLSKLLMVSGFLYRVRKRESMRKEAIETNGKCKACGHPQRKHSISGKVCRASKGKELGPCECEQFVSYNGTDSREKAA